jgi:fatty-acyl-CoA synthase
MSESAIRRQTVGDILRRTAARLPDKTGLVCGEVAWTYREFDRIANRLANGLAADGIRQGDRVAILSRNSHAFAAMRFALARLGAVLVPINFMLNADEVGFILRHSGARRLAVGADLLELARQAIARETAVESLLWLPGEDPAEPPAGLASFDAILSPSDAAPDVAIDGGSLLQIIYTSGTESAPKGAMLTHDAVLWQYVSCVADAEIHGDDLMLHALPLYHCAQLDVFFGPGVYAGATNVITGKPTPANLLDLLSRYRVSSFFAPPSVWIGLLRDPGFDSADLSALAKGYYGASIMPVEVLRELATRLPRVRLWNLYGQTEIAPLATMLGPDEQLSRPGSAGRPVRNVETRVVDDDMRDVGPGEVGEIVHRSPQLMSGYYKDPERTADAFHGGWFHSGDLAVVDADGYITVVDRKKDMIKTGGENVSSREVEETLYGHPAVSEVAVVGLPDPRWIEAVTAVVVPRAGHEVGEDELIAFCRERLAHFKSPRRVIFAEALPKNPSGKVLKRSLRETFNQATSTTL